MVVTRERAEMRLVPERRLSPDALDWRAGDGYSRAPTSQTELLAPGLELVETPLLKAAISLINSDSAGDY